MAMYAFRVYWYPEITRNEWSRIHWVYFLLAIALSAAGFLWYVLPLLAYAPAHFFLWLVKR